MKTHHCKSKSKRQALHSKYNIKKKMREHRRRMKKEAKRLGLSKKVRKDPGIPNSWPFKAEMLQKLEEDKEKRDEDMAKRRAKAKSKSLTDKTQMEINRKQAAKERDEAKAEKREAEAERFHLETMQKTLPKADVLLQVLDSRDPLSCRCKELEAWAQENKKRIVFVLAKGDLITPDAASKWLQVLGQVAPTVVVQAEAGREGISELLNLLGYGAANPSSSVKAVGAVGVVGYSGTGKRALCKAIRQELKTPVSWLLEGCRLRPAEALEPTVNSALHAVICTNVPRGHAAATSTKVTLASGSGAGATAGVDPIAVVKEFLTRLPQQAVLRHFRLPAFQGGGDGFLKTFSEDRKLKNKKGKAPKMEAVAQRVLAELPALPGCYCAAPEASTQSAQNFWSLHADSTQKMQAFMQAQAAALTARGVSGPAVNALAITSSAGPGLAVDVVGDLDNEETAIAGQDDVSDSAESDDCSMEGSDLEGEEEEEMEGEDSEEEMSEDM